VHDDGGWLLLAICVDYEEDVDAAAPLPAFWRADIRRTSAVRCR
jgi:hypothetical protein